MGLFLHLSPSYGNAIKHAPLTLFSPREGTIQAHSRVCRRHRGKKWNKEYSISCAAEEEKEKKMRYECKF